MNAMEELNYVPNSSARRLKRQTETIAVYVPRITNPFFSQMVEVMGNYASDRGYQLILCQTSYSRNQEINYLELLKTKQVDGLILTSIENEWSSIEPYMNYGPIMLCNEYNDQAQVPTVYLDQIEGDTSGPVILLSRAIPRSPIVQETTTRHGLHPTGTRDIKRPWKRQALLRARIGFSQMLIVLTMGSGSSTISRK